MIRPLTLLLALVLAIAPAVSGMAAVEHVAAIVHQIADDADGGHETGLKHVESEPSGCSAMPGHCVAELIVPAENHVDTFHIALVRYPIQVRGFRIGVPVSADPPPPRA